MKTDLKIRSGIWDKKHTQQQTKMLIGDFRRNLQAGFQGNMSATQEAPKHMIRLGDFFLTDFDVVIFVNLIFQVRYFCCF